jgi:hypothetical protein
MRVMSPLTIVNSSLLDRRKSPTKTRSEPKVLICSGSTIITKPCPAMPRLDGNFLWVNGVARPNARRVSNMTISDEFLKCA